MLDHVAGPLHGGASLPPHYHDAGRQTRASAVADRWTDYLGARDEVDRAADRLGRLVTSMAARASRRVARRLRAAAVSLLQAFSASTAARMIYRRAAVRLHITTPWRGAEGEAAFHCRVGYAISLARAFAVATFGGPGVRW